MKVSYAITAYNEVDELKRLLDILVPISSVNYDEIIVQLDNRAESKIRALLFNYSLSSDFSKNIKIIEYPLNNDFAKFKNNLKNNCKNEYIFFLDADEHPNQHLLNSLNTLLEMNQVDMLWVPRVNTVQGITPEDITRWGWNLNDKMWVNYPDYQGRICLNTDEIKWEGKVHEHLVGYSKIGYLPAQEEYSLYHPKTIEKQIKQNQYYSTI